MTQAEAAAIVRQTAIEMRLPPGQAKLAIEIAARAIERGRHFTASEKLANLRDGILADGDHTEDGKWLADFITEKCGVPAKPEAEGWKSRTRKSTSACSTRASHGASLRH